MSNLLTCCVLRPLFTHQLSFFAAADGRQERRGHGTNEPVRPQTCRWPQVQLRHQHKHFPQHQHQQLSAGSQLPRLPHPLRWVCVPPISYLHNSKHIFIIWLFCKSFPKHICQKVFFFCLFFSFVSPDGFGSNREPIEMSFFT